MLHSIKQKASLTHPALNFRNKDGGYTFYQRIPLSNCEPMLEHCGTHCHTVWYLLSVNLFSIGTSLVELGLKDLVEHYDTYEEYWYKNGIFIDHLSLGYHKTMEQLWNQT